MLDAVTAFNQLVVIRSIRPRGVALWRLGSEDPALWQVFGKGSARCGARRSTERYSFRLRRGLRGQGRGPRNYRPTATGKRILEFDPKRN
jgi:hypothetical protein